MSDRTVSRIMKQDGFQLRMNAKQLPTVNHPDQDRQFKYIETFRYCAEHPERLLLSLDAKAWFDRDSFVITVRLGDRLLP